ncbi:NTF2-related export protein 2-like [Asterias rubens]|uniref:NTF2-related export protein 2-like n=1 Tax=Asterias rubens TaxID=7604 RepID=UPI00145555A0|nr:NTF2-related export protein 2-like [Asterias rubens]
MAASTTMDIKSQLEQATLAGKEFHKLFYEKFDKRRNLLNKLYMDTATMVWNGNPLEGGEAIIKFLDQLPTSEHTIDSLDCQPIPAAITQGQTTVMVIVGGWVKFEGNKRNFQFTENFMLTRTQAGVWKIASDCFRYQE